MSMFPYLSYLKYLVSVLLIPIFFLGRFALKKDGVIKPEIAILALILYGAAGFVFSSSSLLGLKDLLFMVMYLTPCMLFYDKRRLKEGDVNFIFLIYVMCFLLSLIGKEKGEFSLSGSSALFEGTESFVFGAFLIYFSFSKNKLGIVVSLFLLFMTLKRIALLGVIGAFLVYAVSDLIRARVVRLGGVVLALGFVVFLYALVAGYFDELLVYYLGKGSAELTLGRTSHYIGVLDAMVDMRWGWLLGNSAGSTYPLAIQYDYFGRQGSNLHSDTLKIFYEYGVLMFIVFYWMLLSLSNPKSRSMATYIFILLLTDNILIYVSVMFYLILLIKYLEFEG